MAENYRLIYLKDWGWGGRTWASKWGCISVWGYREQRYNSGKEILICFCAIPITAGINTASSSSFSGIRLSFVSNDQLAIAWVKSTSDLVFALRSLSSFQIASRRVVSANEVGICLCVCVGVLVNLWLINWLYLRIPSRNVRNHTNLPTRNKQRNKKTG